MADMIFIVDNADIAGIFNRSEGGQPMRSFLTGILIAFAISVLTPLFAVSTAEAAIRCDGPYQKIRGYSDILTPYCEDSYLAKVARTYGVRVSANTIRHNPNRKLEVCQFMGFDPRVFEICSQYRGSSEAH